MPEPRSTPSRRPRRRRSKFHRTLKRYLPSVMLLALCVICIGTVIFTASSIASMVNRQTGDPQETGGASANTKPSEDPDTIQLEMLLAQAEAKAVTYDYTGAISILEQADGYADQPAITEKIKEYRAKDDALVSYTDLDNVTHLFFHSLIVDTDRAFDGDDDTKGYNLYMVTVSEFRTILQSMYDRGFVLVSPYDIAYEVTDNGSPHFVYGNIRLPEGKTPFLLSQDDVNYYSYMIGTGSGKNETPIFADTQGDGFASRIVIDENGFPTCEYMDTQGNVTTGEYDLVPILENFIQEHPDFSYHGARAILGVTGYEGVFGYRTKPDYKAKLGEAAYQKEVDDAKAVAKCLRDHGWILASHSYGHPSYADISADRVAADSQKWENTVQPIIGETDILLFPHGADIGSFRNYTTENEKFNALYRDGYRYFFNVDSKIAWSQIGDTYFRGSRRNIDGYRMFHNPDKLEDLFDVSKVFDPARPTPVPTI